ncbi:hypothetical protein [Paenibacillus sp. 1A_MP2]|uniref:hypothetical protein n=1 Tax=Paenibacillus sp. 1A_MP2 TaxID=3457495 RepID=UPI003FCE03DF
MTLTIRKFRLGKVRGTPGCLSAVDEREILLALRWHMAGNWGDISEEEKASNEEALKMVGGYYLHTAPMKALGFGS